MSELDKMVRVGEWNQHNIQIFIFNQDAIMDLGMRPFNVENTTLGFTFALV